MKRVLRTVSAVTAAAVLATTAACGGPAAERAKALEDGGAAVTIVLPFGSCLAYYPMYVAKKRGYFKDAKLTVEIQSLDGSTAALQAVLADKAEIAASSLLPLLQAVDTGGKLTAFYGVYQGDTFTLQTKADSGITSVAELKGKTLGVSAAGGGDEAYAKAVLTKAGLKPGEDVKLLPVGDGGAATVALDRGKIAAYSSSYFDTAVIRQRGMKLTPLKLADFPTAVDGVLASRADWAKSNPKVVEGFGRALAQATTWTEKHVDEALEICSEATPEDTQDMEFAKAVFAEVMELTKAPEVKPDKIGYLPTKAVQEMDELMLQLGLVKKKVPMSVFDNSHSDAFNTFDRAAL